MYWIWERLQGEVVHVMRSLSGNMRIWGSDYMERTKEFCFYLDRFDILRSRFSLKQEAPPQPKDSLKDRAHPELQKSGGNFCNWIRGSKVMGRNG
jgi:hypothetical protein